MDSDTRNTSIVFTARDVAPKRIIVSRVEQEAAVDILGLAGATSVFRFHKLLGEALARRILHPGRRAGVLKRFENLVVAEAPLMRTSLVDMSLRDAGLRNQTGVNVVGLWERGRFSLPGPDTRFSPNSVIVAAGTPGQIESLERLLGAGAPPLAQGVPLILGGGRVGLAAAGYLRAHGYPCAIVDKKGFLPRPDGILHIQGDAAELDVLERAGLRQAPSVLITTHDDDTNIYLTIYCRRLQPGVQIIARATRERNVGILHAAGADLVLSLATIITGNVLNVLAPGKVSMLNEGLNLFRCRAGEKLGGVKLRDCGVRERTGCTIVAVRARNDELRINPDPEHVFGPDDQIFLIGDIAGQARCYALFGHEAEEGGRPQGQAAWIIE
jgi:Trk K+ transport system NAD-binding subunit